MSDDQALRAQLRRILDWEDAHASFDRAAAGLPARLRGVTPDGWAHSAWQLLEHLRICQHDILDFCRNPKYVEMAMEDYWPRTAAPPSAAAWKKSVTALRNDLEEMKRLAEVIGVVIDHQQQLAEIRLAGSMRDAREEVDVGVCGQLLQRVAIAAQRGDALLPGRFRRRGGPRPVVRGKGQLDILGVPAEVEDVVLRAPQMLDELPRRVVEPVGDGPAEGRREALNRRVEGDVGIPPVEELHQLCAQCLVPVHAFRSLG